MRLLLLVFNIFFYSYNSCSQNVSHVRYAIAVYESAEDSSPYNRSLTPEKMAALMAALETKVHLKK